MRLIYRSDIGFPQASLDVLREALKAAPLDDGEWEVWPHDNGLLTFWRLGTSDDVTSEEPMPWLRGYLDLGTEQWEMSNMPAEPGHEHPFPVLSTILRASGGIHKGAPFPESAKQEAAEMDIDGDLESLTKAHQLEQTIAGMQQALAVLSSYYREAKRSGFDEEQAFQLTRDFQRLMMEQNRHRDQD